MRDQAHAIDRRAFLRRASAMGATVMVAPSLLALAACSRKNAGKTKLDDDIFSCDGTKILTREEQQQRKNNHYTEQAEGGDKTACMNCQYFVSGGDGDDCGACGIISGPINPHGHCDQWQPAS